MSEYLLIIKLEDYMLHKYIFIYGNEDNINIELNNIYCDYDLILDIETKNPIKLLNSIITELENEYIDFSSKCIFIDENNSIEEMYFYPHHDFIDQRTSTFNLKHETKEIDFILMIKYKLV
jgi:hypothetical protein